MGAPIRAAAATADAAGRALRTTMADGALHVPSVAGDGILLRPFRHDDLDAVLDASRDPRITDITTVPVGADARAATAFASRQHDRAATGAGYSFAIEAGGTCVGQIGLWLRDLDLGRATIGYWVAPSHRRRGHAAAALRAIVRWGFAHVAVDRMELSIDPANAASLRVAELVGFEREGLLRSWEVVGDERRDKLMHGLTRQRWVALAERGRRP